MTIRDRRKQKWAPAFMMPEHGKFKRRLLREYYAQAKPLLDEYQIEEFENQIHFAMEYDSQVILTTWTEGYTHETKGHVHHLDPIGKDVHIKNMENLIVRIKFSDIIHVKTIVRD